MNQEAIITLLKSLFVSSYLTLAAVIAGYAGWILYQGGDIVPWGGVLLTVVPILGVIGRLMLLRDMPRTSARFPIVGGLGVIGSGLAVVQGGDSIAPILAIVGLAGFLLYAYWYSSFKDRSSAGIKIGSPLPEVSLLDVQGNSLNTQHLTDRPAILIFYRGNWCPLCMAQVKELAERYREISAYGVRVALISPQPHSNTVGLAKKFDVDFDFLTDSENRAARILGINSDNGLPTGLQVLGYDSDTVMPTVIITGRDGAVIWVHETDNYRVRPDPDVYLDVLRNNGIVPQT